MQLNISRNKTEDSCFSESWKQVTEIRKQLQHFNTALLFWQFILKHDLREPQRLHHVLKLCPMPGWLHRLHLHQITCDVLLENIWNSESTHQQNRNKIFPTYSEKTLHTRNKKSFSSFNCWCKFGKYSCVLGGRCVFIPTTGKLNKNSGHNFIGRLGNNKGVLPGAPPLEHFMLQPNQLYVLRPFRNLPWRWLFRILEHWGYCNVSPGQWVLMHEVRYLPWS